MDIRRQKNKAVKKAIILAGSQEALARLCGVKQQNVNYWLKSGIPVKHVLMIERKFKPHITRYELRPDIYPED